MRYTGPRGKAFSGDKGKARSLQRLADKLVGSVVERLEAPPFNGTGHLVDRQRLDDGSWLYVSVNAIGLHRVVRTAISSPESTSEIEDTFATLIATESGYVQWDDLTQDVDFGVEYDADVADTISMQGCVMIGDAYINARPQLSHPHLYSRLRGGQIVFDREPDSFWTTHLTPPATEAEACSAAKRDAVLSDDNPLQFCTGKMRLYQQAKLGHKLGGPCHFSNRFVQTNSNSGILKAPDGQYWIADIKAYSDTPSVDFYKIEFGSDYASDIAKAIQDQSLENELAAENQAFAASTVSALQYSTLINDGAAPWEYPDFDDVTRTPALPLAHGWKFSWDTNRAAICLLRCVSSNNLLNWAQIEGQVESRVYEITFLYVVVDIGGTLTHRWVPNIELIESNQFRFHNDWNWWLMLVGRRESEPWNFGMAPNTGAQYGEPENSPVYCYYTASAAPYVKNNTLSICRVTRYGVAGSVVVNNPVSPEYDTNCYAMCPGGALAYSSSRTDNSRIEFGVSFCGEITSGTQYGAQQFTEVSGVNLSGEWVPDYLAEIETPHRPDFSWTYNYYDGGWINTPTLTGCNTVLRDITTLPPGIGTFWKSESYYLVSGGFDKKRGERTGYRGDLSVALAIPLSDAESVIVVSKGIMTQSYYHTRHDYHRDTWGARLNDCCGLGITASVSQIYDVFRIDQDFGGTYYASYKAAVSIYGKSGSAYKLGLSYSGSIESSGWPKTAGGNPCILVMPTQYWTSLRQPDDQTWLAGITVVQGIGPAKKMNTRVTDYSEAEFSTPFYTPSLKEWLRETAVAGGYPPQLAEDDNTHPIGVA